MFPKVQTTTIGQPICHNSATEQSTTAVYLTPFPPFLCAFA